MGKIITILTICFGIFSFGQFKITPENYKNVEDESKNFLVLEFPNKTKSALFIAVKSYINSKYKGVKYDGYNEIENEQIVVSINKHSSVQRYKINNRYEINFKDGKIMIRPTFIKFFDDSGSYQYNTFLIKTKHTSGFFYEDGRLISKDYKNSAEYEVNKFVGEIIKVVNDSSSDW